MTDSPLGESAYVARDASYLVGLRPQDALAIPLAEMLDILRRRFGDAVDVALSPAAVNLATPLTDLPVAVRSPRCGETDSSWMRRTNMIGINVRTVGDYGGVVKYAMTLPAAFDSIHLLPIWEPGVVESLYGIAGWNLNAEFFSQELQAVAEHLDTVDKQLRATSNLVHVMGKTIGMDVIPHTDRFSEAAVGTPDLFEWMRVVDREIVDHSDGLTEVVERVVHEWLETTGAPGGGPIPPDPAALFALDEASRLELLFGQPNDLRGRTDRRVGLLVYLKRQGLEPVPATMGVPFRGITVDPDPQHTAVDSHGLEWPDYVMTHPQLMSRVFSPLARYKLYERIDDNRNWEIDFSRPRPHVWEYVCNHYAHTQHVGNFDFMRGDMSHVQMRPDGVPQVVDEWYDILGAVKVHIAETANAPWFGYFAESFLPARDVFQFGEELDHLEASLADATLGDLQSTVVGSSDFLTRFRRYLDDLATRHTAPAFTVFTADKDDPRFDEFYRAGNEARLFTALFVTDMPSYTGLGFEIRDVHDEPVENERYTKLFVFRETGNSNVYPSKARFGNSFVWGENEELFRRLTRLRTYAESVLPAIEESNTRWLVPPDATALRGLAAWTQDDPSYVFVVNYDLERESGSFGLPAFDADVVLVEDYSTTRQVSAAPVAHNGFFHRIASLAPGEARAYRLVPVVGHGGQRS
ncbi:MAG: hypothetical protein HKN07_03830 [Acidimicrobiia bacterium]|nr:hypothetical protein [Acidimicrobiia bacterium]